MEVLIQNGILVVHTLDSKCHVSDYFFETKVISLQHVGILNNMILLRVSDSFKSMVLLHTYCNQGC